MMASEEVPAKTFRNSAEQQIWLEELCSSNGLDYCDKADYKHTEELEMFLNGIPIIPSLHQFSGLIKLCLVGHQISKIENLKLLAQLEELWLCECSIQIIEGLDANTMLKKLYLYDNMIEKIQNLSHLLKLEVLWLNGNEISKIEGISNLDNLKEINLAENKLSEIGHTFDGNKKLVSINLSGNLITSFKDLTNLCNFPCLKSLSFKEPLYRANPVSLMCNYSTFILFHFPHLDFLDSYDVSQKTLKELAETTVAKKKLFYKMRLKTLERSYNEAVKKLEEAKTKLQSVPANMLCKVSFAIKQIERDQEEMKIPAKAMNFAVDETKEFDSENRQDSQSPNQDEADVDRTGRKYSDGDNHDNHAERRSDSSSGDELEELFERVNVRKEKLRTKLNALKERIGVWEKRRSEIEASYKEKCEQARMITDAHVNRLFLELETVGNVRFEDGTNSDTWFNSVYELVMARFSEFDYKDLPVNSLKVQRIIKIYNKTLHTAFDDHLDEVRDKDDSIVTTRTSNRDFDYLFHISNQSSGDSDGERLEIIENGFKSPTDDSGHTCGIQLTNCVSIADKVRLKTLLKHVEKDDSKTQGYRHGQLLLCKTYIGRSTKASKNEKKINRVSFPNAESVYQTRRHAICPTKSRNKTSAAITDMCECPLRRCTWHVFNPKLILPEYLVEFEYGTRVRDPFSAALNSIFSQTQQSRSEENFDSTSIVDDKLMKIDEEILQTEPYIKVRPRLTVLTEDLLLRHTGASFINRITSLDLHGSGLSKLKPLSTLNHLRKLVVSFNELKTLQDLSGMTSLEYLDASFNKITSVDGFKGCIHLTFFDISWNRLHYTREEVGLMRKYLPALKLLNLKHNPWLKEETLRMRCIGRLRNLTRMDNEEVTEEETAMAVRMAACSRIAYITILAHSRTDVVKPRTLSLDSTASVLMQMSKNKPVKLFEDDKKWFYKVTCLQLDNQHLSKISNLEHLENLRFVSFNHNDITKIEGLENCPKIEELSLIGNCISKLEGIDHLLRLNSLNMSNNNLLTIDGTNFEKLAMLENLSFENNLISHLKSLQKAVSLTELYIGNNQIVNIREIFNLKTISNLRILDLAGNPLAKEASDYRLFAIFHLQTLRAFDGIPVDQFEESLARDTYGGKLTQDFVAERLGHSNFVEVCELDLPNLGLRNIDLGDGTLFKFLTSVNLEHNNLTSFGGLIHLSNLQVLGLNFNHIESIIPKPRAQFAIASPPQNKGGLTDFISIEGNYSILDKLEVLHLGFNGISSIASLQLGKLRNLRSLFLQGNDIAKVDGLEGNTELRELVLDKNKIKSFSEFSFSTQWKITELHVEENRLRELSNLSHLVNLQRLYVGLNRIQESSEIEKLESLLNLIEISIIGNPVSRRLMHRPMLVFRQPNLISIDGIPVTNEERTKAELYFLEQQGGVQLLQTLVGAANISLPGINSGLVRPQGQVPLKVTQVQLSGSTPEFTYNVGARIQNLERLHNLSPPPFLDNDMADMSKNQKNSRKMQSNINRRSGSNRDNNGNDNNKHRGRR